MTDDSYENALPPSSGAGGGDISTITIEDELRRSYLDYAMSVIVSRALPDARDGLKPVHRRILYSMYEAKMTPERSYSKCARVVGDVLGRFHPHGDASVYMALVRMAQPFSMGLMLVDGQGNFGSVDGDMPASMRYTECRMAPAATALMADIDKDTVDFQPNYDEKELEPVVLPSRIPNLLVNGAGGIAVGMATNIPPHNLGEVVDAALALLDDPNVSDDALLDIVPGPDFLRLTVPYFADPKVAVRGQYVGYPRDRPVKQVETIYSLRSARLGLAADGGHGRPGAGDGAGQGSAADSVYLSRFCPSDDRRGRYPA